MKASRTAIWTAFGIFVLVALRLLIGTSPREPIPNSDGMPGSALGRPQETIQGDPNSVDSRTLVQLNTSELDRETSTSGPLEVFEVDGTRSSIEYGEISVLCTAGSGETVGAGPIMVSRDVWSVRIPAGCTMSPQVLTRDVDGRTALMRPVKLRGKDASGRVLAADWMPGMQLRVLDSGSLNDLDDVEVLLQRKGRSQVRRVENPAWLEDSEVLRLRGRSPIVLPCFSGLRQAWVRAGGHEWKRIAFWECGSTRTITLRGAGTVECHVTLPGAPHGTLLVRVQALARQSPLLGEVPVERDGTVVFEGIAEGEVQVTLEPQDPLLSCSVHALRRVEVLAGQTASVDLDGRGDTHGTSHIIVRLRTDSASVASMASATLCPVGDTWPRRGSRAMLPVGDRGDLDSASRTWELTGVVPGEYDVSVSPSLELQRVRAEADRSVVAEFTIHDLADVEVQVLDEETGVPLPAGVVLARPAHDDVPDADIQSIFDQASRTHHLRIAPGTVRIRASDQFEHLPLERLEQIHAGRNSLTMTLRRQRHDTVSLVAEADGSPAAFDAEIWFLTSVRPIPPCTGTVVSLRPKAPRTGATSLVCSSMEVWLETPGRYRVELPRFPGYAALAPIDIESHPNQQPEYVIHLIPE